MLVNQHFLCRLSLIAQRKTKQGISIYDTCKRKNKIAWRSIEFFYLFILWILTFTCFFGWGDGDSVSKKSVNFFSCWSKERQNIWATMSLVHNLAGLCSGGARSPLATYFCLGLPGLQRFSTALCCRTCGLTDDYYLPRSDCGFLAAEPQFVPVP